MSDLDTSYKNYPLAAVVFVTEAAYINIVSHHKFGYSRRSLPAFGPSLHTSLEEFLGRQSIKDQENRAYILGFDTVSLYLS